MPTNHPKTMSGLDGLGWPTNSPSGTTAEAESDGTACYALRVLKWAHCGKEGWMSEYATNIEIEDEGAGEFLLLTQPFTNAKLANGGIAITPEEWPTMRAAIEAAFADISLHNAKGMAAGADGSPLLAKEKP